MHESLKKMIDAGAEVMKSGFAAAEDGKFNVLSDVMEFVDDVPEISAAYSARNEIKEHVPDLKDPAVMAEAKQYYKDKFDITDDVLEEKVEKFVTDLADLTISVFNLIDSAKALFGKEPA